MKPNHIIITFTTSYKAMAAEQSFKKQGIAVELIPTPRAISSECGFCLRVMDNADVKVLPTLDCENIWIKKDKDYEQYKNN